MKIVLWKKRKKQDILNVQNAEFSVLYNNLESLNWDPDAGRYKPQPSPEQEISVELLIHQMFMTFLIIGPL